MKGNTDNAAATQVVGNTAWDGMSRPRIYYAMAAVFSGLFLAVLDGTICNVALPQIAASIGVSSSDSIWIVNAFQLVIMMTLLPFSNLGELVGYKRVYSAGVVIFTLGSLFCCLTSGLGTLVAARVFQGIGASMVMSVNTTLVRFIYPRRHLGKGIGLNATVVAIASAAGPTIAAGILSVAGWPWLFAINIPVGIVTFVLAVRYLPDNPVKIPGRHFRWKEAVLNAVVFGLFIGSIEAVSHEAGGWLVAVALVVLLYTGAVYVKDQLGRKYPMLPFDLLRIPVFTMSVVTSILSFTSQMLGMVALPFFLAHTFGFNAAQTGLLMTAWPLAIVFVAPVAGSLVNKVHPGLMGGIGLAVMSAGMFLLAFIPEGTGYAGFVWRLALTGAGFGMFQSPNNHLLLTSAPAERSGSASGMQATARLVGQTTGAALVALLFHVCGAEAPHWALLLAGVLTAAGSMTSMVRMKV